MRAVLAVLVWLLVLSPVQPAAAEIQAHVRVKSGQTLSAIARRYDCTVEALQRANELDGTILQIGQRLAVPVCKGKARPSVQRVAKAERVPVEIKLGQSHGQPWHGRLKRRTCRWSS